ncbi:hypothetical protein XH88_29595 [Bradyrhizobium sp. CCBAU 51627]|nr:hypothetical protein [Bradyrhizobium sp. CCBAU 51627]
MISECALSVLLQTYRRNGDLLLPGDVWLRPIATLLRLPKTGGIRAKRTSRTAYKYASEVSISWLRPHGGRIAATGARKIDAVVQPPWLDLSSPAQMQRLSSR